jgi:hypothetical protein
MSIPHTPSICLERQCGQMLYQQRETYGNVPKQSPLFFPGICIPNFDHVVQSSGHQYSLFVVFKLEGRDGDRLTCLKRSSRMAGVIMLDCRSCDGV